MVDVADRLDELLDSIDIQMPPEAIAEEVVARVRGMFAEEGKKMPVSAVRALAQDYGRLSEAYNRIADRMEMIEQEVDGGPLPPDVAQAPFSVRGGVVGVRFVADYDPAATEECFVCKAKTPGARLQAEVILHAGCFCAGD